MRATIHLVSRRDYWPLAVAIRERRCARVQDERARRGADLYAHAEDWVGPENATTDDGIELLVRRYLGGFGPATPPRSTTGQA